MNRKEIYTMMSPIPYKEIITGNMHSRLSVENGEAHIIVKSYNQKMVLSVGDRILLCGKLPHQRQMYFGWITRIYDNRFNLADETGFVHGSYCADGTCCIIKY